MGTCASMGCSCRLYACASQVGQLKENKYKPLLDDYKFRVTVHVADLRCFKLDDKNCLLTAFKHVPVGAKLLRAIPEQGAMTTPSAHGSKFATSSGLSSEPKFATASVPSLEPDSRDAPTCGSATFGIFRRPAEFLQDAIPLEHPFDSCRAVPDGLLDVLFFTLPKGPVAVMRRRLETLKRWKGYIGELEVSERELHEALEPGIRHVLRGKRLLLLRRIAEELGWPDTDLREDIRRGFPLVGAAPVTGVFELNPRPDIWGKMIFMHRASLLDLRSGPKSLPPRLMRTRLNSGSKR